MPLQDLSVPIAFGQGYDTKTDPKAVIQGKLIDLVDGVFTNPHRVSKRLGGDFLPKDIISSGTIQSPKMAAAYKSELLIAASPNGSLALSGPRLFSYSESEQRWADRGKYVSAAITKQNISGGSVSQQNVTQASNGNFSLVTYDTVNGSSLQSFWSVIDNETGTHLISDALVTGSIGYSRSILLGSSQLAIFYMNSSQTLCFRLVTFALGLPIIGSEQSTGLVIWQGVGTNFPIYDVLTTSTGGVIVCGAPPNNIKAVTVSSSGTVGTPVTLTAGFAYVWSLHANIDSTGNVWIYWAAGNNTTATTLTVKYAILSSTLTSVLAPTVISGGFDYVNQMAALSTSTTTQTLYFSSMAFGSTGAGTLPIPVWSTIYTATANVAGSPGSPTTTLQNVDLYSKVFSYNGSNYIALITYSKFQSTGFIIDLKDNGIIAKFLPAIGEGYIIGSYPGKVPVEGAASVRYPGYLNSFFSVGSGKFSIAAGYQINGVSGITSTISMGSTFIYIDFNNIDAYQSMIVGDSLILNGGVVQLYDGNSCAELGFNQYPDNIQSTTTNTGGSLADGTYEFVFVYQWSDISGNIYQASSNPTSITVSGGGGTAKIAFDIATLGITQKTNVKITPWMSQVNQSILYQAGSGTINNPLNTNATITITAQPSLTGAQLPLSLYTNGGVVENIAPPAAMVMMSNQNRGWLVPSEAPDNSIWPSKTYIPGTGISFSDILALTIDSKFGAIASLIGMDEKTCIIKSGGIMISTGDAADDTGANASFTNPQVVPSDVGGLYSRGTILIPDGVIFKTKKGLYLLSRGLTVAYFGAEAEAFNDQDVQAAMIAPTTSQVRFLTSDGFTLVYDYIFKQWGRFSNYEGYSSTVWNGKYVYVRADGDIFIENETSYLDSTTPYSLAARIAWIKPGGIQGFQRVREAFMLGDHISPVSGHGVNISAAYDFEETFLSTVGYKLPTKASQSPFQYRELMPRQKCDSISLLIQEIVTGTSGEYVDFTDLTLNLGIKRGQNKLPASQSVG